GAEHIGPVKDQFEFIHENKAALVNQREVGSDTHSFQAALKHVLRQDPDVILVGEMRDLETISVALTAAETGHLVFATLHTQDAAQTIDRIIDVYPPHQQAQVRTQLSGSLQGIVSQTLIKRAKGRGRVVATEVLMATHAVTNLIREGKTHQIPSAMQAGRELGMHTMDQSLADLVNAGAITYDAALTKTHDPSVLKRLVTRESATASPFGQEHDDVDYAASPVSGPRGNGYLDETKAFAHRGRDAAGKSVNGSVEASSEVAATGRLRVMGITPISLTDAKATGLAMEINIPGFEKSVSLKDLAVMTRQMSTMISSGLSLLRTLTILADQTESVALRRTLSGVRSDVETGLSLSEAMGKHAK